MSAGAPPSRRPRFPLRSRALCAVAVLLVACAALFANAPAAQAQTSNEVWSATLTVGTNGDAPYIFYGWNDFSSYAGANLSDQDFTFEGNSYNLDTIYLLTGSLALIFDGDGNGDIETQATRNKLIFSVGSDSFSLGAGALHATTGIVWSNTGLSLSAGQTITVKIKTVPKVNSVELTSDPNDDGRDGNDETYAIYGTGILPADVVEATVTFNDAVDITGTPRLTLLFGTTEKTADCAAATNTTTMVCSYTVAENDTAPAGVAIKANSLTRNGGTIRAAGTTADAGLTHAAAAAQSGHKVDGIRPTLVTTGSNAPKTSTDGTKVILTFSEDIGYLNVNSVAFDPSQIAAGLTGSFSGTTVELTLLPVFTIEYGDTVTVQVRIGMVRDSAGNRIAAATEGQTVANEVPRPPAAISMVEITSDPGSDAIYSTGDAIEVTATFDRAVAVTGKPRIRLRLTGNSRGDRWAEYESGSGSTELVFSYSVQSSDESVASGISVGDSNFANEDIDLNGGTIKVDEPGGADASLGYGPLGRDSGHRVNWALPTLTGAATSVDGTKIFLRFSETLSNDSIVVVSGTNNVFTVSVDGTAVTLTGTMSGSSILTPVSGATVTLTLATALTSSTQSVTVSFSASALQPGSLADLAKNPAASFSNQAVTNQFGATGSVSTIALTSDPNDDARPGDDNRYAIGDTVAATVTFSGAVDITGTPQLTLLFGTAEKIASCAAATNTTTMVCSYTVVVSETAPTGVAVESEFARAQRRDDPGHRRHYRRRPHPRRAGEQFRAQGGRREADACDDRQQRAENVDGRHEGDPHVQRGHRLGRSDPGHRQVGRDHASDDRGDSNRKPGGNRPDDRPDDHCHVAHRRARRGSGRRPRR